LSLKPLNNLEDRGELWAFGGQRRGSGFATALPKPQGSLCFFTGSWGPKLPFRKTAKGVFFPPKCKCKVKGQGLTSSERLKVQLHCELSKGSLNSGTLLERPPTPRRANHEFRNFQDILEIPKYLV
jgi:hypothetical protein